MIAPWTALKRRKQRKRNHPGEAMPLSMFRMVKLDDNPFMTYFGWRPWCSGLPYWDDGSCECRHSERVGAS